MNPVFILMVLVGGFIFWLLLSFIFIPLGRFIIKKINKLCKILDYEDEDDDEIRN